jgi:predicted MFS family arabinose efflux permease
MTRPTSPAFPITSLPERGSSAYVHYVIALIWIVLLLRFVDIQIIAVLLESIRAEFGVSDTLLGLLSGTAFALFYGTLGVPVAWLADRYNRRNIIAAAVGLWSAMTALCGMASSFLMLFLARVGVGVGEAGGTAPAFSLVSDYVPAHKRATVFALLNTSVPAGVFAGMIIGGWVNASHGWRGALMIVGIPGILVALLIRLSLREPRRGLSDVAAVSTAPPSSMLATVTELWAIRSYRHLVLASSIFTLGAYGSGIWIPSFFIRVHSMPPAEVATWLAFVYGGGGILGATLGGWWADRLMSRTGDSRWQARLPAITTASILPFSFFVYLWPQPIMAIIVHAGTTFLMHTWMGPAYATVQSLAGARRRAMAAGINQLALNLIALGLGPLLVGVASDYFNAAFGASSLRYSILTVVSVTYTWSAVHFALASRTMREDLQGAGGQSLMSLQNAKGAMT